MKEYRILHDGREVAGRKNPGKGKIIALSEAEARHPLRIGQIALAVAQEDKSKGKK